MGDELEARKEELVSVMRDETIRRLEKKEKKQKRKVQNNRMQSSQDLFLFFGY